MLSPEFTGTSIFGSKICHFFAKIPKNEGMCVDVVENKRTKSVTFQPSVDIAENKGRSERAKGSLQMLFKTEGFLVGEGEAAAQPCCFQDAGHSCFNSVPSSRQSQ